MLRILFVALCSIAALNADNATAASVAAQLSRIGLDARECYRVIDLNISKGAARIYLTSGYLIFAKPVNGERIAAVFASDVEGGDGEVLLLPPLRSERLSLANFTEAPNLDEHFHSALLIFTDGTGDELLSGVHANPLDKQALEMGALLAEKSSGVLQNLVSSFQVRLVQDLLSAVGRPGVFYAAVAGRKLGNFDVIYDASAKEQMLVGQLAYRNNQTYFDTWTSFATRPKSGSPSPSPDSEPALDNFRIEATIGTDLTVKAVTRLTLTPKHTAERVLPFSISRQMRVHDVEVDGHPAEVFQKESLRSNLIRGPDNEMVLVVTPEPLTAGRSHEMVFRHDGAVITKAGDRVYAVGARGTWYPRHGLEFARYDLTFRYPRTLDLVATGELKDEKTEGEWRIARRVSASPIRFAGFNLGDYESVRVDRGEYRIQAYANRKVETALQPKSALQTPFPVSPSLGRRRQFEPEPPLPAAPPDPTARLQTLAGNVANAFEFMTATFGPPAAKTVAITPIPGGFGQGFPGLVYLSTVAYLDPSQRPAAAMRDRLQQTFFSELLQAHELAHQWWGNLVTADGYQDVWMMESLANYSALLYLEKKEGTRALDAILEQYKTRLLAKGPNGRTVESAGPVTLGYRLQSSQSPEAANLITYEKGTWVMHMLRKQLGDAAFEKMLRELCQTYRYRALSTDQFRLAAARFLPPHAADPELAGFFDTWVYGTGIPAVKLTYAMHGLKLTGTVVQSGVGDDFTAYVPIEVQTGRQKTLQWVATGSDPVPFSIFLHRPPTRVSLDSSDALITRKP